MVNPIDTEPVDRSSYIYGHQLGSYMCQCSECLTTFVGQKRCTICFECAAISEINRLRGELRAIPNQTLWDAAFCSLRPFARIGEWLFKLREKAPLPIDGIFLERQSDNDIVATFVDGRGFTFGLTRKNFIDAHFAAIKKPAPSREPLSDNHDYGKSREQNTNTLD